MPQVDLICKKIIARQYELSRHAMDQSILRDISMAELEQAVTDRCELIEDYPGDKYGPSCLLVGYTRSGRPLHMQCGYPDRTLIKVITLYEPDPGRWVGFKVRRDDSEVDR